jgi:CBS domain containing-hemolysin-like protein
MQRERVHFVFVIDEHGGMEGILTLEDLLEEIVGEINDEYDEEARDQIKREGDSYILDGMLSVRDVNQYLQLNVPEDDGYTTIAGFLMKRVGRLMERGDRVEHQGAVFEVERVDKRRATRIRLTLAAKSDDKNPPLHSLLNVSLLICQTASGVVTGVEPTMSFI